MNISLCLVKFVLSLSNLPACENSIDLKLRHESYKMVASVSRQECRLCLPSQKPSQESLPLVVQMSKARGSVQLSGKLFFCFCL